MKIAVSWLNVHDLKDFPVDLADDVTEIRDVLAARAHDAVRELNAVHVPLDAERVQELVDDELAREGIFGRVELVGNIEDG